MPNKHNTLPTSHFRLPILALLLLLLPYSCTEQQATPEYAKVVHPEWAKDAVIYEVNVRQYTEEGTFQAFSAHLPRLKQLGVDILWFMPIHPIGELNRKGTLGSYYSVKDYLAVDPALGTMSDFQQLVDQIHDMGMYVLLDWVANHTAWDNNLINTHPHWYTRDSAGNFTPPVPDWSDVVDLNFDEPQLHDYMIESLKFWVREANIDGYRCDVAGMVPIELWNNARQELDKIKPVFMLAEAEGPQFHQHAFDMSYAWDIHHTFNRIARGEDTGLNLGMMISTQQEQYGPDGIRMLFTSNHDENSWNGTVFERMGEATEAFAALTFVLPGMPLIYSGQEAGMDKRLAFFEKDPIEWREHRFGSLYKKLITIKKENEAFWNGQSGGLFALVSVGSEHVLVFTRTTSEQEILCLFNLQPEAVEFEFPAESDAVYDDLMSGMKNQNMAGAFTLEGWEYRILLKSRR